MYRILAMLVTIAIPIIFLAGTFDIQDRNDSRLAGAIVALVAGMLWSGLGYFRILVRGGAAGSDPASIQAYESATWLGTLIRGFALMPTFACPMLFVIAALQGHDQTELRFAGIVCAVVAIGLFSVAKYVEGFLRGNTKGGKKNNFGN
jgi:hypothetical protein